MFTILNNKNRARKGPILYRKEDYMNELNQEKLKEFIKMLERVKNKKDRHAAPKPKKTVTCKKMKVRLFETALNESTDEERWSYTHSVDYFEKNLPKKVNEVLEDNEKINLFYAEKWDSIKKTCPLAFRIYEEYLDRIAACLQYSFREMDTEEKRDY